MSVAQKPTNTRKITQDEMRKLKENDHKIVEGVFRCYEPRGGSVTFTFKKYKGDAAKKYTMVDGETRKVPLMIAKHLNQNCWYPKHSYIMDMDGKPTIDQGKKVQRYGFESLEFLMDE